MSEALDLYALADFLTRSPEHPYFAKAVTVIRDQLARGGVAQVRNRNFAPHHPGNAAGAALLGRSIGVNARNFAVYREMALPRSRQDSNL